MTIPAELRYTAEHEWVAVDGPVASVGITDYAQRALGDVVYVSVPAPGTRVTAGEPCGEDGVPCATGLDCVYFSSTTGDFAPQQCAASCGADAGCGAGERCNGTACEPSCAGDSDCGGRFVRRCTGSDGGSGSGVCRVVACGIRVSCPSPSSCAQPLFCCPLGAPCRAPPQGVCTR